MQREGISLGRGSLREFFFLAVFTSACTGLPVVGGVPRDAPSPTFDAVDVVDDVPCAPTQTRCGATCVDLRSDVRACGACGVACAANEVCSNGSCVFRCPDEQLMCGRLCVTPRTDRAHCGACDVRCGVGEVCAEGRCRPECGDRLARCVVHAGADASVPDGATLETCADTQNDVMHCGACGNACALAQVCTMGRCVDRCPTGITFCSGTCVDLQSNRNHCGACGNGCRMGNPCVGGRCIEECGMGATRCGAACTDLNADPANCGMCGRACLGGEVCSNGTCTAMCVRSATNCSGSCRELMSDNRHCGACGNACAAGQVCTGGRCVCTTGAACTTGATTACVDTTSNPRHCGACGNACRAGQVCAEGRCVDNCPAPLANCGGVCRDTRSAPSDCGRCGNVCPLGQACIDGVCGRCPTGATSCGGECRDLARDNNHCGRCDNVCPAGEQCMGGMCIPACEAGLTLCGAIRFCVNLQTDVLHCGRCGNACASGEVCQGGTCRASCAADTTLCGGVCRSLMSDNNNCGRCGNRCGATEACVSGACVPRCRPGETVCGGTCVNLLTNDNHCGACDRRCVGGCVAGACAQPEEVFAGHYEACARFNNGRVACWGLGTVFGTYGSSPFHHGDPLPVIGVMGAPVVVQSMTMGTYPDGGCGVDGEGDVVCWGGGYSMLSRKIQGARNIIQVSYGTGAGRSGCALRDDLRVLCWGSNTVGQRGFIGSSELSSEPATVVPIANVRAIANGGSVICALTTGAEVYCWGANDVGQRGLGNTDRQSPAPTRVPGLSDIRAIWAGYDNACARRGDGTILCWGRNGSGELGLGDSMHRTSPTPVPAWNGVTSLSMGANVTCGVLRGEVWCTGASSDGALGLGALTQTLTPRRVGTLTGQRSVHTGLSLTCALQESPRLVRCWGHDDYGQTGSHHEMLPTPTPVRGINNALAIEAGAEFVAVLRRDNTVVTWGHPSGNAYGQLGIGNNMATYTPTPVVGLSDAVQISAGSYHVCARRAGGTVSCWGYNEVGCLGDGSATNRNAPVNVAGLADVIDVQTGAAHSCALRADRTVRCWGSNFYGQLCMGTQSNYEATPVTVRNETNTGPLTGVQQISLQGSATCFRFADGTVSCCGRNTSYELANIITTNSPLPTPTLTSPSTLTMAVRRMGVTSLECDAYYPGCFFLTATHVGSYHVGLADDRTTRGMTQALYYASHVALTPTGALYGTMRNEYGIDGRGVYTNRPAPATGCSGWAYVNPSLCSNTRIGGAQTYVDFDIVPGPRNLGMDNVACAVRTTGEVDCWGSTISGFMRAVGIEPRVLEPGAPVTFSF